MKEFTGWEYLLIDLANHYGLDKLTFEARIQWATENLQYIKDNFEAVRENADTPILFVKAWNAIQDALAGKESGHLVGLDACASGPQIMGAISNCMQTGLHTGLIDPDTRADLYTSVVRAMNSSLPKDFQIDSNSGLTRTDVKDATVPFFYGSSEKPKEVFIEDSEAYKAYFKAMRTVAPGAMDVMETLLNAWQPFVLKHSWKLPDGFTAHIKVMEAVDKRIEVQELGGASFTHRFYENRGSEKGLSIAANVIHSIDGMFVREINRRCNYNRAELEKVYSILVDTTFKEEYENPLAGTDKTDFISLRDATDIISGRINQYDMNNLIRLKNLIARTLERPSFEVICVHDEFKCHPNYMNYLRRTYIEIMAEIADSDILSTILSHIYGVSGTYKKIGSGMSEYILKSNYALS